MERLLADWLSPRGAVEWLTLALCVVVIALISVSLADARRARSRLTQRGVNGAAKIIGDDGVDREVERLISMVYMVVVSVAFLLAPDVPVSTWTMLFWLGFIGLIANFGVGSWRTVRKRTRIRALLREDRVNGRLVLRLTGESPDSASDESGHPPG